MYIGVRGAKLVGMKTIEEMHQAWGDALGQPRTTFPKELFTTDPPSADSPETLKPGDTFSLDVVNLVNPPTDEELKRMFHAPPSEG